MNLSTKFKESDRKKLSNLREKLSKIGMKTYMEMGDDLTYHFFGSWLTRYEIRFQCEFDQFILRSGWGDVYYVEIEGKPEYTAETEDEAIARIIWMSEIIKRDKMNSSRNIENPSLKWKF